MNTYALSRLLKAKTDAGAVPVYDANGNLVGLVDPEDLQPVGAAPSAVPKKAPTTVPPAPAQTEALTKSQVSFAKAIADKSDMDARAWARAVSLGAVAINNATRCGGATAKELSHGIATEVLKKSRRAKPEDVADAIEELIRLSR